MEPILHCTLFPKHHAGVRLHHRCTAVRPHRSSSVQGQIAAPEHHSVPGQGDLPGQLAPPVQAETTEFVAARNATVSPCTVGRSGLLCSLHTRNVPFSRRNVRRALSSSSLYRRKKSTFRRVIPLEVALTWPCTVERSRRFSRVISPVQVEEVAVPSSYSPRSCADLVLYRGQIVLWRPCFVTGQAQALQAIRRAGCRGGTVVFLAAVQEPMIGGSRCHRLFCVQVETTGSRSRPKCNRFPLYRDEIDLSERDPVTVQCAFRGDLVEEEPKVPTTAHLTSCAVEGGRPMRIRSPRARTCRRRSRAFFSILISPHICATARNATVYPWGTE